MGRTLKNVERRIQYPDTTENEIIVRIRYSGLCGTDEHHKHANLVLGHEGARAVEVIGTEVASLTI